MILIESRTAEGQAGTRRGDTASVALTTHKPIPIARNSAGTVRGRLFFLGWSRYDDPVESALARCFVTRRLEEFPTATGPLEPPRDRWFVVLRLDWQLDSAPDAPRDHRRQGSESAVPVHASSLRLSQRRSMLEAVLLFQRPGKSGLVADPWSHPAGVGHRGCGAGSPHSRVAGCVLFAWDAS